MTSERHEGQCACSMENIRHRIDWMKIESKNNRNDGWMKDHYRNGLRELRDYINKALEE
jgi:hypothetical protein